MSGAVPPPVARPLGRAAGVPRPVCPGCGWWCVETLPLPHGVRPCRHLLKGVAVGGAFRRCEGRLGLGASLPSGRAVGLCHPRALGTGVRAWGPGIVPLVCMPRGGCVPQGCWGLSPGGWPATVVRVVWCQALSLFRPLVLWGGQPGFPDPCIPRAVGAGVGAQHRPHSVRPCGPALCAAGVAEGRPRGGWLSPL